MSLRLEIVSQHRRALGEHGVKTFGQDGGTIGRSLETDWALPDQHRFLSSQHASIDYRSGAYYIVDTSKNGVYVNDSQTPVGRGNPQRLFPGDRIRIGDYEISVAIDHVDDTREVLAELSHVDPVDLRDRVEAPDPTSYDLIGEEVITGVGIELILEEDAADTLAPLEELASAVATSTGTGLGAALELERELERERERKRDTERANGDRARKTDRGDPDLAFEIDALPESPSQSRDVLEWSRNAEGPPTERSTEKPMDALGAFCLGAGISAPALSAEETQALMRRVGEVTREFIIGLLGSLQLRSLQKAELRQSGTTIQPRDNNVLKFSPNAEEALQRLLFESSDFYLAPRLAVRAAFGDINEHQRLVLQAVQTALGDYLQQGGDRLPPAFLDAMARAYGQEAKASRPESSRPRRREAG